MPYQPNRRSFLIAGGLTALASTRVLGANDTLRLGVIGAGERMKTLLDRADKASGNHQIIAVSDVYKPHRDAVKEHSNGQATTHLDYREVLDNKDIDAVLIASTRVLGANDTLRLGVIGAGERMKTLLDRADKASGNHQIVAVSDVYKPHRDAVKEHSNGVATTHLDYREVLDNKDIDAVLIASPDHWHVHMAVDALAAGKDVYLEKPVTHTIDEGATLIHAVRSSKQILQCGMQQRSWVHFRNAVDLIQAGNLGRILQVRTYWWQNYQRTKPAKPVDTQALDWKQWLGSAPDEPFNEDKFYRWRWYWNFGGGAMTDLFTHWIDVVQWAMKSDEPSAAQMLGDKYMFEEWDCPDTIQAAFRYPGFDVVYEGMMASSIDDGGLEFRGTKGTLKIDRAGMSVYREGIPSKENPVLSERSPRDGTFAHVQNFFDCIKSRKEPNAPIEAGVAAARAGHIGNLAYHHNGQTTWPPKSMS